MKFKLLASASVALLLSACGGGSGSVATNGIGDSFTAGDTGDASSIMGSWQINESGQVTTLLNFFTDGTYSLVDRAGNLEWGIFSRNESGQLSARANYDEEDTGFSGGVDGETTAVINRDGETLVGTFADDEGTVSVTFQPVSTDGIYGAWRSIDSSLKFNMLNFLDDGTYFHARVDNDTSSIKNGAEKGTITRDEATGEITFNVTSDGNGDAGLSSYSAPAKVFLQVAGDTLTVSIDTEGDGVIDDDFVFMQE